MDSTMFQPPTRPRAEDAVTAVAACGNGLVDCLFIFITSHANKTRNRVWEIRRKCSYILFINISTTAGRFFSMSHLKDKLDTLAQPRLPTDALRRPERDGCPYLKTSDPFFQNELNQFGKAHEVTWNYLLGYDPIMGFPLELEKLVTS